MINLRNYDKDFFVQWVPDRSNQLFIWKKDSELNWDGDEIILISKAMEYAKKGESFAPTETKASHLLFAELQLELKRDIKNYLTLAFIGWGKNNPLIYYGNDVDTKKQYQIANALLGFGKIPDFLAREDATKEEVFQSLKESFNWMLEGE